MRLRRTLVLLAVLAIGCGRPVPPAILEYSVEGTVRWGEDAVSSWTYPSESRMTVVRQTHGPITEVSSRVHVPGARTGLLGRTVHRERRTGDAVLWESLAVHGPWQVECALDPSVRVRLLPMLPGQRWTADFGSESCDGSISVAALRMSEARAAGRTWSVLRMTRRLTLDAGHVHIQTTQIADYSPELDADVHVREHIAVRVHQAAFTDERLLELIAVRR